jgi:hypothetical protein
MDSATRYSFTDAAANYKQTNKQFDGEERRERN